MLQVRSLCVHYRGRSVLEDVSLNLMPGELVGLIGPNGAGKSTLIKALLGLVPIASGHISWHGQSLRRLRQQVAYVPQRSQIDWDYPIVVQRVVMMALTRRLGWWRSPNAAAYQTARAAMERMQIWDLRDRPIGSLSGGQQQRVFLARAIAQSAEIFLFDEPFTGIDKHSELILLNLFAELRSRGHLVLVCSHEWGSALERYDRLLLLNRSLLADDRPQVVMTLDNIRRAYGENTQLLDPRSSLESMLAC
ncbi:MAG: metal ABC transporter ATP-binding protein [Oscillatoriales cyanobacterium]|nr:MAG: metal ABC transporter ATP-binding protein [Oscillatoriales cyanobacterium]